MKKTLHILTFSFFCIASLFSCKNSNIIDNTPEGIFITGDYTGRLNYWEKQTYSPQVELRLRSFEDSTQISYPAFLLNITRDYAFLDVGIDAKTPKERYYIINHRIDVFEQDAITIQEMKFIKASGITTLDYIRPEPSKNVILNGKFKK